MTVAEYLASVALRVTACFVKGEPSRPWFEVLEAIQQHLPYNPQLDVGASGPTQLVLVVDTPQACVITVRPTFLGMDVDVTGVGDPEVGRRIGEELVVALDKELRKTDDGKWVLDTEEDTGQNADLQST